MCSIDSGIANDEEFDVFPHTLVLQIFDITTKFMALPRKFKISLSILLVILHMLGSMI
jgi:sulfite reductase beta subunit-like hemoprotein